MNYADLSNFQKSHMSLLSFSSHPPTPVKKLPPYVKTEYAEITHFIRGGNTDLRTPGANTDRNTAGNIEAIMYFNCDKCWSGCPLIIVKWKPEEVYWLLRTNNNQNDPPLKGKGWKEKVARSVARTRTGLNQSEQPLIWLWLVEAGYTPKCLEPTGWVFNSVTPDHCIRVQLQKTLPEAKTLLEGIHSVKKRFKEIEDFLRPMNEPKPALIDILSVRPFRK